MAERPSLAERLLASAGYADHRQDHPPDGGSHAAEFGLILGVLEYIGNRKVDEYGDSRLRVESADYDTKMLYSDLYRKHIRIDQLMRSVREQVWSDAPIAPDKLMETFGDLAIYAVRGIQILARLEEQGLLSCNEPR